jgi:hypothetical protein
MKNFKKVVVAAALLLTASFANASVVQHTSGTFGVTYPWGQTNEGYPYSDFDFAKFTFASEYADKIVVSSPSYGQMHSHGSPVSAMVDVYNGTNWINVFTSAPVSNYAYLADIFANPIEFSGMNISGLRLSSSIYVDQAFHSVAYNTTYTLSGTPAEVPEPGTMLLIGLGVAGVAAMRRKKA